MRGPGVPPGTTCDRLVSNLDLPATILRMCGIDEEVRMHGWDLAELVGEPRVPWRTGFINPAIPLRCVRLSGRPPCPCNRPGPTIPVVPVNPAERRRGPEEPSHDRCRCPMHTILPVGGLPRGRTGIVRRRGSRRGRRFLHRQPDRGPGPHRLSQLRRARGSSRVPHRHEGVAQLRIRGRRRGIPRSPGHRPRIRTGVLGRGAQLQPSPVVRAGSPGCPYRPGRICIDAGRPCGKDAGRTREGSDGSGGRPLRFR